MTRTAIYGLIDPRHGIVRYAGKTVWTLERRLRHHLWAARSGGTTRRDRWIQSLAGAGHTPTIVQLDAVAHGEDWCARERFWIASCRHIVGDLMTNISDGGDGVPGVPRTPEWCAKISEAQRGMKRKPISERHRQAIIAANTGRKCPKTQEHREKISAALRGKPGHPQTAETIEKISKAQRGKKKPPLSAEQLERLIASVKRGESHPQAKLTSDMVIAIRAEPKGGKALADKYSVSYSTIKMVRAKKIWEHI